jgi:transcriptional regulator with XRE-family HTH domain
MANVTHWTERSTKDFLYSIASDFIEQLQERMEAIPMTQSELARAARVTKGYVSRVFKNPGNLSLDTIVKFARIVGLKVSIVGYLDTNDPANSRGPISADVFRAVWQNAGQPADMWAIRERSVTTTDVLSIPALQDHLAWSRRVHEAANNEPPNVTGKVMPLQFHLVPGTKQTNSLSHVEVPNA